MLLENPKAFESRALAIEALERAAATKDPMLRQWWISIARTYHRMAEHIERLQAFKA